MRPLSRSPRKALYFLLFSTSEDHSIASARRVKPRSAGGPQLRKSGGTELRKSAGTHPRKSGGSDQRKLCSQSLGPPGSHQVGPLQSAASAPDVYSESGWLASATRHPDAGCIMHLVQFGLGDGMAMREEFATQSRSLRSVASVMVMTYGRPGFLFCAVMRPPAIQ